MRNRFHALCPYFAMFPESFAAAWIAKLTKPRELVVDPFCGRGTAPFQALLMERAAVGGDLNPVAYCVTRAKVDPPELSSLLRRIDQLEALFKTDSPGAEEPAAGLPEFFRRAYAPETLAQILFLQSQLQWRRRRTDCMLAALILGALHGDSDRSPSYLSNQMPRTISTKPGYSVRWWDERGSLPPERDAFALVRNRARFRYRSPTAPLRGNAYLSDARKLARRASRHAPARLILTSPPYLDVTSFEEDQWLRLWFLGGPPRPMRGRLKADDRHTSEELYLAFLADSWSSLAEIVTVGTHLVARVGGRQRTASELEDLAVSSIFASAIDMRVHSVTVSKLTGKQTGSFRPGSAGLSFEIDIHAQMT